MLKCERSRHTRAIAPLELLRAGPGGGGVISPLDDPGRLLLRALPELAGRVAKRTGSDVDSDDGCERLCCKTKNTMVRL